MLLSTGDEVWVKVPRLDHNSVCARVGDEHADVVVIRSGCAKLSYNTMSTRSSTFIVASNSATTTRSPVLVEHAGHAHQHHVVVVDQRHGDRTVGGREHPPKITALGV